MSCVYCFLIKRKKFFRQSNTLLEHDANNWFDSASIIVVAN